jgi:hypothetical protein
VDVVDLAIFECLDQQLIQFFLARLALDRAQVIDEVEVLLVGVIFVGAEQTLAERRQVGHLVAGVDSKRLGTGQAVLSRAPEVAISFCLFEDLQAEGPFAPIFRDFRNPEQPIDWLGG